MSLCSGLAYQVGLQAMDAVELTALVFLGAGVYTNSFDVGLNIKNGFPVFTTMIEANYINKQEDRFAAFKLTDEDKQELHRLARDPRIGAPPLLSEVPVHAQWINAS